jgi:hypothetical protein
MADVKEILNARVEGGEIGTCTVREYLITLLENLWMEKDSFSGKRPFGNSGWQFDLYQALITAGLLPGVINEEGYLDEFEAQIQADAMILEAIESLR